MARRILLADDSVTAQNMGRRILTDAGYEVITVNNGSAALKKIAEQKPDLIILDVYMPGYGGLEVCSRLKENRETSRIPVLLTVGKLEPFKAEEARRVRADAFVVKPFEASELLTALTRLEDKIVPGPEPHKPGRFAKAAAALEQEASPQIETFGDNDAGWKDRLIIPAKPKQVEPQEEPEAAHSATAAAAFSQAGRPDDFKPIEPAREYERPMPAGLPSDIRPEEIAAIAAAAAALSGAPQPAAEAVVEPPPPTFDSPAASASAPVAEEAAVAVPAKEPEPAPELTKAEEEIPAATFASAPETSVVESPTGTEAPAAQASPVPEEQIKEDPAKPAEPPVSAARGLVASIAEALGLRKAPDEPLIPKDIEPLPEPTPVQSAPEQFENAAEPRPVEPAAEDKRPVSDAEVLAALATLSPSEGDFSATTSENIYEVPATVAASVATPELATVGSSLAGPRWIAEEIPADESESTFLLEHEMEKAYAAFAAAEAHYAFVQTSGQPEPTSISATAVASGITGSAEQVNAIAALAETAEPIASPSGADAVPPMIEAVPLQEAAPPVEAAPLAMAAAASAAAEAGTQPTVAPPLPTPESQPNPAPAEELSEKQSQAELAAAWAHWEGIRESVVAAPPEPVAPVQEAAHADATPAAETKAESESDPEALASIVDNMLAELKPKLMEELKKKLDKKK